MQLCIDSLGTLEGSLQIALKYFLEKFGSKPLNVFDLYYSFNFLCLFFFENIFLHLCK
jgi:hypothetical protein